MEDNKESFDEFRTRLLKKNSKKHFKIKNSWGSKFIYRSVDKNHPIKQVSECDFLHIIRTVNNYLVNDIINGKAVFIPNIGTIYIKKRRLKTFVKDNKITTQKKVDWNSTHKLWYTDEQARKEKLLIRFTNDYAYEVKWFQSVFNNRKFFKFVPMRALKIKIKEQVLNNKEIYIYGE